jgi:hypothetical protein
MLTFTQKPKGQTAFARSTVLDRAGFRQSPARESALQSQWAIGNQAITRFEENSGGGKADSTGAELAHLGHDFGRIPIHPRVEAKEKKTNGDKGGRSILIAGKSPDAGTPAPAPAPAPSLAAPAAKKTAGVDSFVVQWAKNATSGPTVAKLKLDTTVKFKKDATHDPALAEFRQNAGFEWETTDGPNKGFKASKPFGDDNYSRADDEGGHGVSDVDFVTDDNPGTRRGVHIDKDDVINFTFTAEQMVIDTSDGNKVVEKRGPHTATITGKDPRVYDGVPVTLR